MERKDFLRQGGPCFYFDTELFAPTTDSFALGWFAAPKRGERVCDLGSGTGLLGTLLLARAVAHAFLRGAERCGKRARGKGLCRKRLDRARDAAHRRSARERCAPRRGEHGLCRFQPAVLPGGERRERRGRGAASRAGRGRLHARRRRCRGGAGAALGRTLRARPQARAAIRPFLHAPRARAGAEAAALRSLLGRKRSLFGACGGTPRREDRSIGRTDVIHRLSRLG